MFKMNQMNETHDNKLFEILKEAKSIPNFFDTIFGFLYRRTDFYYVPTDQNLGVGLPENLTERLLWQSYNKYKNVKCTDVSEPPNEKPGQPAAKRTAVHVKSDTLESFNGAVLDNYSWSQTISDVDVQVKLPHKLTAKDVCVDVTCTAMTVKLRSAYAAVVSGELCNKCKNQETIWSLDGDTLQIHIEKAAESWWDCLLKSEPRLDLNKVECSRPFHELSDEAQAKIEELSWNQDRRRLGLPTTDQMKLQKSLRDAWNVEGSPFSGTFDPNKVTLE